MSGSVLQPGGGAAAGCDLFISKPCLPDELIEAVERLAAAAYACLAGALVWLGARQE